MSRSNLGGRKHIHRAYGRSLGRELLERRIVLDASGFPGNECPPDLDLSAVAAQQIEVGSTLTIDLLSSGATATDTNLDGSPTGDTLRFVLDPDVPEQTPLGASITSDGVFTWTPTADQVGTFDIVVLLIDSGTPPLADAETFSVEVMSANDAPVVDLNGPETGIDFANTFTEDGGPVAAVDSTELTVTDADDTNIESATATITNLANGASEVLAVDVTGTSITAVYDDTTGVLSLTGSDTLANYQQVLRTLTYENTSDNPLTGDRIIEVIVNDGEDDSATATSTITVDFQNDAPVVDLNGPLAGEDITVDFTEAGGPIAIVASDMTVTDIDNINLVSATITITNQLDGVDEILDVVTTGTNITAVYDDSTGVLSLTGVDVVANYEQVIRTLTYDNTTVDPTTTDRIIEIVVNDQTDDSIVRTSTVQITQIIDPTVDLNGDDPGTGFLVSFIEGDLPVPLAEPDVTITTETSPTLVSATVTITNQVDGPAEVLAAVTTGTNITAVYDDVTGVLSLTGEDTIANYQTVLASLSYENSSQDPTEGNRTIEIVVNDGRSDSLSATATVTVFAVNQRPDLADPSVNPGVPSEVTEFSTVSFAAQTTDPDHTNDELIYQVDSDNSGLPDGAAVPTISNPGGVFSWTPGVTGTFSFRIIVLDPEGGIDQELVTFTVVEDTVAPEVASILGTAPTTALTVSFNEAMATSAFEASSYSVVIVGGPNDGQAVAIDSVSEGSESSAILNFATELVEGTTYRLTVIDTVLADLAGNQLTGQTVFDIQLSVVASGLDQAFAELADNS